VSTKGFFDGVRGRLIEWGQCLGNALSVTTNVSKIVRVRCEVREPTTKKKRRQAKNTNRKKKSGRGDSLYAIEKKSQVPYNGVGDVVNPRAKAWLKDCLGRNKLKGQRKLTQVQQKGGESYMAKGGEKRSSIHWTPLFVTNAASRPEQTWEKKKRGGGREAKTPKHGNDCRWSQRMVRQRTGGFPHLFNNIFTSQKTSHRTTLVGPTVGAYPAQKRVISQLETQRKHLLGDGSPHPKYAG